MSSSAVFGLPIKRLYGEQASLTTTALHLAQMPGYHEVMFYCASAWRLGIAPKLAKVFVYTAATTTYVDYTSQATDRSDSTHVPLDALGTSDIVYMGFQDDCPRGVYINIGSNANAELATLDVEYVSAITAGVNTWSDVASDSDGTTSGGATLAVDGIYTWDVPASLTATVNGVSNLHWIRFKPSASLSATVDILEIVPACVDTNYAFMEAGVPYQFSFNTERAGAFEFDHTGTATLDVTWIKH